MRTISFFYFILSFVVIISAQIKVACIGNSITSGYSNTGSSYVPKLSILLGKDYQVQNYGVSGTTLLKKGDNPYWKTSNFTQALASNADIITIKLGTNDTKTYNWDYHADEFKNDYEALIDTLLKSSKKKPVIYPVFPVPIFKSAVSVSWGMRDSIIKNHEIPIIKGIASQRGLTFIDAYTPLLPFSKYFTVDGVHPDSSAADSIAHLIYRIISSKTAIAGVRSVPAHKIQNSTIFTFFNGTETTNPFDAFPSEENSSGFSIYSMDGKCIHRVQSQSAQTLSQQIKRGVSGNSASCRFLIINSH